MHTQRSHLLVGLGALFVGSALTGCDRATTEPGAPLLPATGSLAADVAPAAEELPLYEEIEPYIAMVSIIVRASGEFRPGKYLAIGYYESQWNNRHEMTTRAALLRNGAEIGNTQPKVKTASGLVGAFARIMYDTVTIDTPQPCLLEGRTDVSGKAFFWYQVPTVPPIIGTTPPRPASHAATVQQPPCPALAFDQTEDPLVVYYGQQRLLSANCYGEQAQWTSSNIHIASVSGGVVTGTSNAYGMYTPPETAVITVTCRGESAYRNVLVRRYDSEPTEDYGDVDCNPIGNEDPSDDCPEGYDPPCTECQQWLNWECTYTRLTGFRCTTWEEWDCQEVDANLCEEAMEDNHLAIDRSRTHDDLALTALPRTKEVT